ncbi:MAG: hypothetical protein AB1467_04720 [Candidatus Diapherotrites archaeon]
MKKLIAVAKAPLKVIVSGEHGVVHGTPGVTLALQPFMRVNLYEAEGKPSLELTSERGKVVLNKKGEVIGEINKNFDPFVALTRYIIEKHGFLPRKHLIAEIVSSKAPKGVGVSASISAALASSLFHAMEKKPRKSSYPERDDLWMAVQSAEEIAHGGRPSGIDAMTVLYGSTKLIRLVKDNKIQWNFEKMRGLNIPKNTTIIVVDTYMGGERSKTGEMILKLAKVYGLTKKEGEKEISKILTEMTPQDRVRLEPFRRVFNKVLQELHPKGNAKKLGAALNKNQALLRKGGVTTKDIEKVIKISRKAGAYGAKLTGAGGPGGAVIVLAHTKKRNLLESRIKKAGFSIFPVNPTKRGTHLIVRKKPTIRHIR